MSDNSGAAASESGATKERMTFAPSLDLAERIRNYVFWTPGASVNQLVVEAVEREMARLEKELNKGKPFPQRTGRLKPGRSVSS